MSATPACATATPAFIAPSRISAIRILRGIGGGRYAFAAVISALGAGLIRPFLLLYGVTISHLSPAQAGLALSAGFLVGLILVPLAGRWVDTGARRSVMLTTIAVRMAGLVLLVVIPGPSGFLCACLLQGAGNQAGPLAQAAVVSSLATGYDRDAVLAMLRSLGNAGMGVGALLATAALGSGAVGLRWLAVINAGAYLVSGALISTIHIPPGIGSVGWSRSRAPISPADRAVLRRLAIVNAANLPFAFCFDILEVALPIVIVTQLQAAPVWASGIFVTNTMMVIIAQVPVVIWMSRRPRRQVFAAAGLVLSVSYLGFLAAGTHQGVAGAASIAAVSTLYNLGEILYTGVGTALVIDAAPPHLRGRVLARWQLSLGLGRAIAPMAIGAALSISAATLWLPLAATTLLGAAVIVRRAPIDSERSGGAGLAVSRLGRNRRARRRAKMTERLDRRHTSTIRGHGWS